jgi:hypothetical protein
MGCSQLGAAQRRLAEPVRSHSNWDHHRRTKPPIHSECTVSASSNVHRASAQEPRTVPGLCTDTNDIQIRRTPGMHVNLASHASRHAYVVRHASTDVPEPTIFDIDADPVVQHRSRVSSVRAAGRARACICPARRPPPLTRRSSAAHTHYAAREFSRIISYLFLGFPEF